MDKIKGFITVPVVELLDIISESSKVFGMCAKLLKDYSITVPKNDLSSTTKEDASFEAGFLKGLGIKQHPDKTFEMVTE